MTIIDKKKIINMFNNYFADIGKQLTDKYETHIFYKPPQRINNPFKFKLTNELELNNIIMHLKKLHQWDSITYQPY